MHSATSTLFRSHKRFQIYVTKGPYICPCVCVCGLILAPKSLDTYFYFDMGNVPQKLSDNSAHSFRDTNVVFHWYHKPLMEFYIKQQRTWLRVLCTIE
jgi:hypothetical protein